MKSWGHFHEVSINWADLRSVFHQIVVQFTDGDLFNHFLWWALRLCVFNFFMNESTNALIHYQLLPRFAIFRNKKWRFANMKICKMKICQSPCRKYERVRAMRRRENGTMHILDKKCNCLCKNQAKVGKFIFNTCCYRISNVFRSHKFHGGMQIWICWNLFQFMLSKLIQDWENLAFFQTHTNASLSDF